MSEGKAYVRRAERAVSVTPRTAKRARGGLLLGVALLSLAAPQACGSSGSNFGAGSSAGSSGIALAGTAGTSFLDVSGASGSTSAPSGA